ncbi:DUF3703 domain-containing protein [Roseateles sp.]|uniref:DUF3703 domain-containing protein n=1 Tax=Roseateles sp. TaxID=1971397 RepID=UPI0025FF8A53|nr:DUF3703 domain-containing protein [Roseateles sp.]MBV8034721.1 DUF3703 domain-containing protein [Roseateles sp.]
MNFATDFARRIRPSVSAELAAAGWHEQRGNADLAARHLERAHILGQASTIEHVRVHAAMLGWALRQRSVRELLGQAWRLAGAALKTWLWVPWGNTGMSNVSGFRPMPVPPELRQLIAAAHHRPGTR